jgi:tellurite methyltransferase
VPRNWEEHYSLAENLDFTPAPLLVEAVEMLPPGRALDIACGPGRNALYLAELGWRVVAVDSSRAAIRILQERAAAASLGVEARVADLEAGEYAPERGAYDLVCDVLYLQRSLFPALRQSVREGGLFVGQILLRDPQHDPAFRLEPGELREEFSGWKILYYSEGADAGHIHRTAQIIARRA